MMKINADRRNYDVVVEEHENISNEVEDGNDVHVIVHDVGDVSDHDEKVPLLVESSP